MQIRTRLTLQFILVVTLIIVSCFGIIYFSSASYRHNELYQRLENKAITTAGIFVSVEQIDSTMLRIFDLSQKDKLPFENVSIYDNHDREIYTSNDSVHIIAGKQLLDEVRLGGAKRFRQGDMEVLGLVYGDRYNRFVVFAGAVDLYGYSKLSNLRRTLFLLLFMIMSIVAVSGWLYAGRALRPLSEVINQVEKLGADKLGARLHRGRNDDEIGRLVDTFNVLFARLQKAFDLQRLLLSGASHELKNPLTAITSQLQVAMLNDRSAADYRKLMASILEDIRNLNKTTSDLMEFGRLSHEKEIILSSVRIDDVLWHSVENITKNNPEYKVNVELSTLPENPEWLEVHGNEALLKVAFNNLIENACKFSPEKTCYVQLAAGSHRVEVSFIDKGIGLSSEEMNLVFLPFYRADSTAQVKGHGIGLALTKKIVELHGADITVDSAKGEGTNFTLVFPPKF